MNSWYYSEGYMHAQLMYIDMHVTDEHNMYGTGMLHLLHAESHKTLYSFITHNIVSWWVNAFYVCLSNILWLIYGDYHVYQGNEKCSNQ